MLAFVIFGTVKNQTRIVKYYAANIWGNQLTEEVSQRDILHRIGSPHGLGTKSPLVEQRPNVWQSWITVIKCKSETHIHLFSSPQFIYSLPSFSVYIVFSSKENDNALIDLRIVRHLLFFA